MSDTLTDDVTNDQDDNGMFNLFAKLNVSLDRMSDKMDRQARADQQRLASLPNYLPIARQSNPSGATDIQDFGGPQPGRQWVVRLFAAFASPLAANASVVTLYVGQNMGGPGAGMLPASMARWQFASVPGLKDFSDQIKVLPGEHVVVGLTGVPASSAIMLNVVINDQPLYAASYAVAVEN